MNVRRLGREELAAVLGGLVLAASVFVAWYSLGNEHAVLNGHHGPGGTVTAWQGLTVFRYLFLAAAAAPIILALVVVRGGALSWPRGEVTALVGVTAIVLVLVRGAIIRPGNPTSEIHPTWGFFLALAAAIVMTVAALMHRAEHDPTPSKPPGVT